MVEGKEARSVYMLLRVLTFLLEYFNAFIRGCSVLVYDQLPIKWRFKSQKASALLFKAANN